MVHELGHCLTNIILVRKNCYCHLRYPWFLPTIKGDTYISIYKLYVILSSTSGPYTQFSINYNLYILSLSVFMGPFVQCVFYYYMIYLTDVSLINVLLILEFTSNFYPYYLTNKSNDGLHIINLFYPNFKGFPDPFNFQIFFVGFYIIYWIYILY